MKYLAFILLVISLALIPTRTFSWDADAAKFYPLTVGNKWVYTWYYTYMGNTIFGGYRTSKIVSDTVIAGHRYFRYSTIFSSCNDYIFERIDSASMNVYRRSAVNGTEQLLDSLMGRVGNTFKGKRNCAQLVSEPPVYCVDTNNFTIFGNQRRAKYYSADGLMMMYYRLTADLGLTNIFAVEGQSNIYTLSGCVINGTVYGDTNTLTGISQIGNEMPLKFSLSQNFPNPFNPETKITFQIPLSRGVDSEGGRGVFAVLKVFDALGREVEVLVNQQLQPGTYEVSWDASVYPSGVYYYRLEFGSFSETKKMLLVK